MKTFPLFCSIVLIGCFAACTSSRQTASLATLRDAPSASYRAPEFNNSDRLDEIRKVLPEVEKIFLNYAEKEHFPGYAYGIVVDGSLIFSGSTGFINLESGQFATKNSLFRIASMTKSFTAMAIVKLRDEGKLSLSDPVTKYLPELTNLQPLTADAPPPTLQNLLTMTAGFPEDNPWGDRQLEDTDQEFLDFLRTGISFSTVPSSGYEYSNLGYAMLGRIITVVSGMPYQQYINRNIFQPLGMTQTFWEYEGLPADLLALGYRWEDDRYKPEPMLHDGAYGAMGGLITSIEDFSKYLAFHLSAWPPRNVPETGPILRSSVREMHRLIEPRLQAGARDSDGNPCPEMLGYGYGLRIQKDCRGTVTIAHSGGLPGFGSNHSFLPDYGIGIISFANRTYAPASAANAAVLRLLIRKAGLQPRQLPVSDILAQRREEVLQLLQTWDEALGKEILAENFYLDLSRDHRMKEAQSVMTEAGKILAAEPLLPENQLRGTFILKGEKKDIAVFFSLSPEKVPKVQALTLRILEPSGSDRGQ